MRVGIICLIHESNTFLARPTTLDDFRQVILATGEEVRRQMAGGHHEVSGFFAGLVFVVAVDAVFAPIFRYFDVFDALAPTGVFEQMPKLRAWRRALFLRPSVTGAVLPDYNVRLQAFLVKHDAYLLRLTREAVQ